jgi:FAD/FMN-containing dehydrogenase
VLGDGALVHTKLAPRRATGPDLAQALIGGRGATGIVVGAWLRCARRPVEQARLAFRFGDGAAALAAARALLADGLRPADLALFDDGAARGATLAVELAGSPETTAAERAHAVAVCAGAEPDDRATSLLARLPASPGRALAARDLATAWAGRSTGAALWAIAPAGAALVDRGAAPAPQANPLDEELARALDPQALLAR